MRADPSTKYPTKNNGEQNDANYKSQYGHYYDEKILRPKYLSEQNKLTFDDVEKYKLMPVDFYERGAEQKGKKKVTEDIAVLVPRVFSYQRVQPPSFTRCLYGTVIVWLFQFVFS